jgi:hypothetical protein
LRQYIGGAPGSGRTNSPRLQILSIISNLPKQLNTNKTQPAWAGPRRAAAALCLCCTAVLLARDGEQGSRAERRSTPAFTTNAGSAQITAGILTRTLSFKDSNLATTSLAIDGHESLANPARELSFTVSFAEPNQRPKGISPDESATVETTAHFSSGTDTLRIEGGREQAGVGWSPNLAVWANSWSAYFEPAACRIRRSGTHVAAGVSPAAATGSGLLVITAQAIPSSLLKGLTVRLCYEVYDGFPVIRKWVEISNGGTRWLKLNKLVIDDLELAAACRHQTPLTPGERGAGPSVIAFGTADGRRGVIAVSEIPSALRETRDTGAMGYSEQLFEWVLGPGETFVSEPVFFLAYSGELHKTISAISTPRDRTVEGVYLDFLRKQVGVAADKGTIETPQWCSWSNFGWALNDGIVRQQAELAARCGFALLLLDSGWQKDTIGTEADPTRFPDFAATCRYIHSLGLKLGLWVSCFRVADSPDLRSAPLIKRDGGFGMSFASPWKEFYAQDLARISRKYGVSYFKQDYTNVKLGDIAEGHESRTRQESLLRGLRGLLVAQDLLRQAAPQVASELTHEIYWGTPGVPCDVAVVKHATAYHIPPNDYAGVGHPKERVRTNWPYEPAKLRQQLLNGCFNARQRFFAHRGLPLYALEYYAAHTVNFRGSLTSAVQERQVCSWLMGVPSTFAGDLASLTEENIACYRRLFTLLQRLEKDYGIYRHFQFSGVPAPTDTDWHWWGKLNGQGCGAVVVLRGSQGADERAVNIPWVLPGRTYQVNGLLAHQPLGRFSGKELQDGALVLKLVHFGQEILECKAE